MDGSYGAEKDAQREPLAALVARLTDPGVRKVG